MIEFFFDDSGKEDDPSHRFVVMAGYMAGDWNELYRRWRSLLLWHGLPYIHTREMVELAKEKQWDSATLSEVYDSL